MLIQLPWLFQLSAGDRVTSLLPVSRVWLLLAHFEHFLLSSASISQLNLLLLYSRNDATLPLFLSVYLFYALSQEEVLLSPFLSPRPGNGFPSCGYYANRLQPLSCAEVSVIMALLTLCSSPPSIPPSLYHPSIYFSTLYLLLSSHHSSATLACRFASCVVSFHLSISSLLLTFTFSSALLLFPSLYPRWGCCKPSRGAQP